MAIEVQNSTGAKIFVKALYPEGFREIKPTAIKGETLYLDLSELKRAWKDNAKKHGYGVEPFIVITIVKDGKVAVQGISLKGDSRYQKITILPNYKPLKTTKEVSSESASSGNIQPMDSYWEVLEEYREETIPAVVAEVLNADYSWGQMTYSYMANAHVGFGVYIFVNSEWSRTGTHYTYNVNGGSISHAAFDRGEDVYIWMDFTYRYERWKIHIDGQNFYEEYVFVKSFDPTSLSWANYKPSNVKPAPINSWDFEGRYYSSTYTYPYYRFSLGDLTTDAFSIDVLGFISILSSAGVISPSAAAAASASDMFIDVNYEYSNTQAFTCTLDVYGDTGRYHRIWKGQSETTVNNINTVPVVGFYISQG
ncbi:hypothetical protein [Thermococcus thermotolerans]|uniref:hypothetical protein n=1 Tax=Thermococcus thermotolerans TaxID=2969672 RepID=UPI00215841FF|nr:hypothetical protein [Thermococcus thermotolerans]